ncbi:MAG: hypothetical protein JEZ11_23800 [Desulfobacterales bacterium]|nr:hypothetical protein [Desulfobacterales bacterium]
MQTAKENVMEILKGIPDNSTLEEIQYHLYVRQKIERGIKDIEALEKFSYIVTGSSIGLNLKEYMGTSSFPSS